MTDLILSGIESESLRRYPSGRPVHHSFFISSMSRGRLMVFFSFSLSFIRFQQFSIGYKSGLFPGQSMTSKSQFSSREVIFLVLWHGAPSWRKWVALCMP